MTTQDKNMMADRAARSRLAAMAPKRADALDADVGRRADMDGGHLGRLRSAFESASTVLTRGFSVSPVLIFQRVPRGTPDLSANDVTSAKVRGSNALMMSLMFMSEYYRIRTANASAIFRFRSTCTRP